MEMVAFVFPGQGSQYPKMGADLVEAYPDIAGQIFAQADSILGYPISKICFQGSQEDLDKTIHSQPAVFVTNYICYRILQERTQIQPDFVAGHSLGEYSASVASGCLTFQQGLELVQKRAYLMQEAARKKPGSMIAIIGLDTAIAEEVISNFENVVIANYNCPGQVVISGQEEDIEKASQILKEKGAKKITRLSVSGAFHSPLMKSASYKFQKELLKTHFQEGKIPIVFNVTGTAIVSFIGMPVVRTEIIRACLLRQTIHPVLWGDSIRLLIVLGVKIFVEVGPGKTLCGLIKRINPNVKTLATENPEKIEKTIAYLGEIRGR